MRARDPPAAPTRPAAVYRPPRRSRTPTDPAEPPPSSPGDAISRDGFGTTPVKKKRKLNFIDTIITQVYRNLNSVKAVIVKMMVCNEICLSVLTCHLLEHQSLRAAAIKPLKGLRFDNKSESEHVTYKQFVEADITKLTLNTAKHETRTQSHKWCTIIVPSTLEVPSRRRSINSMLIKIKFTLDYSRPRCMA